MPRRWLLPALPAVMEPAASDSLEPLHQTVPRRPASSATGYVSGRVTWMRNRHSKVEAADAALLHHAGSVADPAAMADLLRALCLAGAINLSLIESFTTAPLAGVASAASVLRTAWSCKWRTAWKALLQSGSA